MINYETTRVLKSAPGIPSCITYSIVCLHLNKYTRSHKVEPRACVCLNTDTRKYFKESIPRVRTLATDDDRDEVGNQENCCKGIWRGLRTLTAR